MSDAGRPNLLESRGGRRLLFAALYFSEGAPIGFVWLALPTLLRERGVDVADIGEMSSLLVLPWALKFLWAPLIDTLRSRAWGFRAWIVAAQLMMGLTLLPLLNADVFDDIDLLRWILILHAICAATQDVSVDALCIASAPEDERGVLNGWMQAGMLVGRAIFGGVALMLVRYIGLDNVVLLMIAAIWMTTLLVVARTRESEPGAADVVGERVQGFRASLAAAMARPATWFGLLFAATAAAGFEAIGAFFGPCLTDAGVSKESIGRFHLGPVISLTLIGSLVGGWASDRIGKRRFVAAAIVGLVVSGGLVALAAPTIDDGATPFYVALGLLYFVIGLFTASSYALLMDMTDPRLGGTQFSAFMGATNLCESWAVFAGGVLAARWGYAAMFAGMSCVSLVGLPILLGMRDRGSVSANRD
ncbi:MAG: MFS transporter [Phycisphaerales bacterium]|nr:MFS transporter [Phycisphaerales bacterium]MCB9862312.1 MFS transporter [Phycisphaerales bacterium]